MGKLSNFLKNNGIKLYTPKGWYILAKKTLQFSKKNKGHFWASVHKKLDESSMSVRDGFGMLDYGQITRECAPKQNELGKIALALPALKNKITFSVIVMTGECGEKLDLLLRDLDKQIYSAKEVLLCAQFAKKSKKTEQACEPSERSKEFVSFKSAELAFAAVTGDYVILLREGDRAERLALFELCAEMNRTGEAYAAIYTDHDTVKKDGFADPYFKPGWSPDLFLANDYIRNSVAFRREALQGALIDQSLRSFPLFVYDLLLQVSEKGKVSRKAGVFFHLEEDIFAEDYSPERDALRKKTLARRGDGAAVTVNEYCRTSVERKLEGEPLISIVIPTCYTQDYVEKCIQSIYERSTYKNFEIIVVDNSRKHPNFGEKRLKKLLKEGKCRILYVNEPFNWARLNNLAAKEAKGEYLLFLNDDTEVITPDWLERLASEAERPDVGEVGALLLYPDGRVQHAGAFMVDYGGGARHWYQKEKEDCAAYHHFLHYRRECTFLTGACIIVSRKKFEEMGGFDETFPVVSNDFDFGLRLRRAGYRNLYLPDVKLTHKEKVSRHDVGETKGEKYCWEVWGTQMSLGDEYYNPNLDRFSNVPGIDYCPTKCMLTGSPTIMPSIIKKAIIVKLDHIGDNVIDLPAVRKVKKLLPDAQLDILCAPWLKNFWEAQPEIDHVHTFAFFAQRSQNGVLGQEKEELKRVIKALRAENYDLSVHMRRHEETKELAESIADYCLTYSVTAEQDENLYSVPSQKDIPFVRSRWSMHDQMISLADRLGYEPDLDKPIAVPAEAEAKAAAFAKETPQFNAPIVVGIHAGSGGDFRQWGERNFGLLCNLILANSSASVILFGGKDEIAINEKILKYVSDKSRVVSVAGIHSLPEFCALVKHVDYFIGNNSGPKHISGIQGVPTLTIDGPPDEQEWSAPGVKNMSVRKITACCPCYFYLRKQCPIDRLCLDRLGAGDVWRALERLMLLYPKKTEENNG